MPCGRTWRTWPQVPQRGPARYTGAEVAPYGATGFDQGGYREYVRRAIYAIRHRRSRRRPFEVRWHAADRSRSRSFITRRLADSYRAELVRAARKGLEFDPATGEPVLWAAPQPAATTWYRHALAYTDMKWPELAAHSRASMAEALATVTPALTTATGQRPPAQVLRAALYGHAFNPQHQTRRPDPATAAALAWLERASLPVARLQDPQVTRQALDALAVRLDRRRAAANTITRKRAVFHNALGYAVELGLLEVNPLGQFQRRMPRAASTADPRVIASPGQVDAILKQVSRIRPELTAFFGCLYYAALRPEEAVALRRDSLTLPASGWGQLTLTAALPRSARAWTGNGTAHEPRGLKLRPEGATRTVPIPPQLVSLLAGTCRHTAPRQTGGCSAVPAAARSAKAFTAGSGTRPVPQHPSQPSTPSTRYCALTTCGTRRCRCGWPPVLPRPRSPPAPGTA